MSIKPRIGQTCQQDIIFYEAPITAYFHRDVDGAGREEWELDKIELQDSVDEELYPFDFVRLVLEHSDVSESVLEKAVFVYLNLGE